MKSKIEALYRSGELARLAAKHRSLDPLLAAIGMTKNQWDTSGRQLLRDGLRIPSVAELRGIGARPGHVVAQTELVADVPTEEDWSEPPTNPAAPSIDVMIADRAARSEGAECKRQLKQALEALAECQYELGIAKGIAASVGSVPPIAARESTSGRREATAVAIASDWHIEEEVDPAKVNGVNEYNVAIAERRIARFFDGFIWLIKYHRDHFLIRDALLALLGDLITGFLHPDNVETNELSPVQAIATLHVWIADGMRRVLRECDFLERLLVPTVSGNHGRITDKMRVSSREANSIEHLLYVSLAREFRDDPRVQFIIGAGAHTYIDIYGWSIRFMHGDDIKYGGGVGGITIPLLKALGRLNTVKHADATVLGHFHQLQFANDYVVNGSAIGYNAYALSIGAKFEPPRQAFFLIDSRRFRCMSTDIWLDEEPEE